MKDLINKSEEESLQEYSLYYFEFLHCFTFIK